MKYLKIEFMILCCQFMILALEIFTQNMKNVPDDAFSRSEKLTSRLRYIEDKLREHWNAMVDYE